MYVDIRGLNFKYSKSDALTVKNFNLTIAKGKIVSILGESGSGKSTVLRLIAGLETPESGTVVIDDTIMVNDEIFIQPEHRGVGMVFQDYALFPHLTVEDNIEFGLQRLKGAQKKERVEEVLNLVKLCKYRTRYPYELSGGQQQRVALARALAPKPNILLMDEPFSNLDRELQYTIRKELQEILNQSNITTVFVTHDRDDAKALANEVVILRNGGITESGNIEILL